MLIPKLLADKNRSNYCILQSKLEEHKTDLEPNI